MSENSSIRSTTQFSARFLSVESRIRKCVGSLKKLLTAIRAFTRERERESKAVSRKRIPIGNLTSQLFANVYMNEFDQFVKHRLQVKNYARYTDDFVIVSDKKD